MCVCARGGARGVVPLLVEADELVGDRGGRKDAEVGEKQRDVVGRRVVAGGRGRDDVGRELRRVGRENGDTRVLQRRGKVALVERV